MYNTQITAILRSNPQTNHLFQGCFPCNNLPHPIEAKVLVVNLDPQGYQGSHWISIYVQTSEQVVYFDSLNLPTSICIIDSFLKNFSAVVRNLRAYQSLTSDCCAHHCISFTYFLSKGYTFTQYLKMLDKINDPDMFVQNIVNKMIN